MSNKHAKVSFMENTARAIQFRDVTDFQTDFMDHLVDLWRSGFLSIKKNQSVEAIIEANDGFEGLLEMTLVEFLSDIGVTRCSFCASDCNCDC